MNGAVLAEGPPPLTQEAADSAIDVIDFMAAVVRGVDEIDVTPAVRSAWRTHLTTYYPMLNAADRYFFATADYALMAIRSGWLQLTDEQRNAYRQAWAQSLPSVLQFIAPVLQTAGAYQGVPVSAQTGPSAFPQAPPSGGAVSAADLYHEIQEQQRAAEEEARQQGGIELEHQVKLNNEAANIQMLTNMAQMRHQAMMAVANNLKY